MNSTLEAICTICEKIRHHSSQISGFHQLLRRIRKEFTKYGIYLLIRSHRKPSLDIEEFYVNAYYDPEDDKNYDIPIEVVIIHNFNKRTLWDQNRISILLIQIFDAVIHELKHQRQSQKKNHKIFWPQSTVIDTYLSDPDEIDAYAFSIAIELCRSIGKYRALQQMRRFTSMSRYKIGCNLISPNLYAYVKVFKNLENPILRKLSKKIYIHLCKVDTDLIFL